MGKNEEITLSYEDAMIELEEIVKQLERGEAKLEESAKLYERGVVLTKHCSNILQNMREQMSIITLNPDGEIIEKEATFHE